MSDEAPEVRPHGARRAARSTRFVVRPGRRQGARAIRPRRRTNGMPGNLGMTVLGALVPGSGYLYAGRRAVGALVLAAWLCVIGAVAWYLASDLQGHALDLAFNPTALKVITGVLGASLLTWAMVVLTSHRLVRPRVRSRSQTVVGYVAAALVIVVGAVPVVRAGQIALAQVEVAEVFDETPESATIPTAATEKDPWAGQDRVNVLLLGGDGGDGREGVRTDSVILVSIDTKTGKTTTFSLPRNMMYAQFPEDSPLHDVYPDGYQTGQGDPGFDMLNAIYGQVPVLHPGILGESDNEGADAVKEAVSGSLGIPVDYYLLVNLEGFKTVVDAIGGITVNINTRVAIQGDTSAGIPPTSYLEPGPDQELDGFHALWFARGRYGSDDYQRMDRQRCAVNALIEAADPVTLLKRYVEVAKAGADVVYTDIPRKLGSPFVQLLLKVKDAQLRSVVFRASDKFFSGDPDYDYVRDVVQKALYPVKKPGGGKPKPEVEAEDPVDVCAYNPVDESDDTDDTGDTGTSDTAAATDEQTAGN